MKRRWSAALLPGLLALTVGLSSCSTIPSDSPSDSMISAPESTADPETPPVFALSYSNEDSLNPFLAKTRVNLDLAPLLYPGLTRIDGEYTAQLCLAASIDDADPLNPMVTLRSDALFSDGSPVTAADVAASFEAAKTAEGYKSLLQNIGSVTASGGTVRVSLSSPDPQFAACLSFPVIKGGTGDPPVGAGIYRYNAEDHALVPNPYAGTTPAIETVALRHLQDADAMLHGLENGTISYYFSELNGGEIPRTSSSTMDVSMPNLLFLGLNAKNADLKKPEVRKAISTALDREEIISGALAGRGEAALSPFPTQWAQSKEIKVWESTENVPAAVAQMEQAGYNMGSEERVLSLELLVSTDNSFRQAAAALVKTQLGQLGFAVTVTELSFEEYEARLKSGDFDLYLGEVRLSADLHLRSLLTAGGSAAYGLDAASPSAAAYAAYLSGEQTLTGFCETFADDLPYIPLCWRRGMAAFHRSLTQIAPHAFDIYYGMESWTFA